MDLMCALRLIARYANPSARAGKRAIEEDHRPRTRLTAERSLLAQSVLEEQNAIVRTAVPRTLERIGGRT